MSFIGVVLILFGICGVIGSAKDADVKARLISVVFITAGVLIFITESLVPIMAMVSALCILNGKQSR